jgi:exosortase A-associated hydrolase 2
MKPFFLTVEDGYRFFVYHPAQGEAREAPAVVYVPPFAEEMNKCRHMAAAAARRMVATGHAVLIADLAGCGDSSGDFGDATWQIWLDDVERAVSWAEEAGHSRIILWGTRLGAILAAQAAAASRGRFERCLFWQPVTNGEVALAQFLRIRIAADMLSAKLAGLNLAEMRAELAAGKAVDVAGYRLAPKLAASLGGLRLSDFDPRCPVDWLEVAGDTSRGLSPVSTGVFEKWEAGGTSVRAQMVQGEPFWIAGSNEDVIDCVPLLNATEDAARKW